MPSSRNAPTDWIIDRLLPLYDFRTRYTREINAPPGDVWDALHAVTAAELPMSRLLMSIRSLARTHLSGRLGDIAPVPELARNEGTEIVNGAVAQFWRLRPVRGPQQSKDPAVFAAFSKPGWAKAALSFQLTPVAGGTRLAAETRVRVNDPASRRAFAAYWLLIRAGGAGLIWHELLQAIARWAEATRRPVRGETD
ncbi:MAG TPA: hypothetical protein VIV12_28350 [Streptosporangiaceae bacterium]